VLTVWFVLLIIGWAMIYQPVASGLRFVERETSPVATALGVGLRLQDDGGRRMLSKSVARREWACAGKGLRDNDSCRRQGSDRSSAATGSSGACAGS